MPLMPSPLYPAVPVPATVPRHAAPAMGVVDVAQVVSGVTSGVNAGHAERMDGDRVTTSDHERVTSSETLDGNTHVTAASIWHEGASSDSSTARVTFAHRIVGEAARVDCTPVLKLPTRIVGAMPNT